MGKLHGFVTGVWELVQALQITIGAYKTIIALVFGEGDELIEAHHSYLAYFIIFKYMQD